MKFGIELDYSVRKFLGNIFNLKMAAIKLNLLYGSFI